MLTTTQIGLRESLRVWLQRHERVGHTPDDLAEALAYMAGEAASHAPTREAVMRAADNAAERIKISARMAFERRCEAESAEAA